MYDIKSCFIIRFIIKLLSKNSHEEQTEIQKVTIESVSRKSQTDDKLINF